MLPRALLVDALRELRRSPARFLSIFAIVAIGAGLFVGIKGTSPNMKYTADQYYDQARMTDIRVLSTLGLVPEDISAIAAVEGVESVQPGYFVDVTTMQDATEYVIRVHSLPASALAASVGSGSSSNGSTSNGSSSNGSTSGDYLNMPRLVEGRLPINPGEAVIEWSRKIDPGLAIGDRLQVDSGKKEDLAQTLATTEFTIVGKVISPYYLTFQREPTDIGAGRLDLFMMVSEDEFRLPVYTEALVAVAGARELDSYSREYSRLVEVVTNRLENLGTERATLRLASLKEQAQGELDKARDELAAREADYQTQITDGEARLLEASNELAAGRAAMDQGRADLETQLAGYQQMISQSETFLGQAEAQVAQLQAQYGPLLERVGSSVNSANDVIGELENQQAEAEASIATLQDMLDNSELTEDQRVVLIDQIATLEGISSSAGRSVDVVASMGDSAGSQVADAQAQMQMANQQVADARYRLNQSQDEMAAMQAAAEADLAAAEAELEVGQAEYETAREEFEVSKAEGAAAIKDANEQLIRAENEIERLDEPTWYVLDRSKIYSYADYAATADRMDAIAALFPVFFFAVAALVSLTTLTRMVDEQRTAIGTYKALGYTSGSIAFKYVSYAGVASLLGSIVGAVVGMKVLPRIIFDSWTMMYELPPMQQVNQTPLILGSVLAATGLMTATAYLAVRTELLAVPATLMRPKAPPAGKLILLERFTALWSRLSFSQKVTMRNIFRYKKRFFMTVLGVAGCSALLVAALGLSDSIGQIVPRQYGEIFTHDLKVRLASNVDDERRDQIVTELTDDPAVQQVLGLAEQNAIVRDGDEEISATVLVPIDEDRFGEFVSLRQRISQEPITLPASGAVVTEQLASDLGLGVGDTISADLGTGVVKKIEIAAIAENYLYHHIYLSPEGYQELNRTAPELSGVMIQMRDLGAQDRIGSELIQAGEAASVTYYSDISEKFHQTIVGLNTIVWAMIVAAGLLAFVVLYNLTNINLSERLREIATIKVLGFYHGEVAAYVYREVFLLTLLGGSVGLLAGIGLHRVIMASIEQNDIMFGDYINGLSFVVALGITLFFGALVALFMYRKLTNIKMVESLKSVE